MELKRKWKRTWKFPHPKDPLGFDKDYNEVMIEIHKLDKKADRMIRKSQLKKVIEGSIRIFLENI